MTPALDQPRSPASPRFVAGRFVFQFPRPAVVMGIVNVTPDSFADGGRYYDPAAAVDHAHALVAEGAEIIDIGGESTRPGAGAVAEAEELRRVLPVIERLSGNLGVPVSIDTRKPEVARQALAAGASLINDVGAAHNMSAMATLLAATGAGYVCMHMQGEPATMQQRPTYTHLVPEVHAFLRARLDQLQLLGVPPDQVVLDVGLGFGKTVEHNLQLLAALGRFTTLGRPLLVGASRKSFIGKILGVEVGDRLSGSVACALWAAREGALLFRVHDVAPTVQALRMIEAIRDHAT